MNTKEAIELVEHAFCAWESEYCCGNEEKEALNDELKQVLTVIEQGKKYEEMWEAFLDLPIKPFIRPEPINWELYLFRLRELEEKYFPDRESQIKVVK